MPALNAFYSGDVEKMSYGIWKYGQVLGIGVAKARNPYARRMLSYSRIVEKSPTLQK